MIKFSLSCELNHNFESWFKSNQAFDSLQQKGLLTCPICESSDVRKRIMTPTVVSKKSDKISNNQSTDEKLDLKKPFSKLEKLITELKEEVKKNSDYVGKDFASEARKMYNGEVKSRPIHGEATNKEVKKLVKEGIPVLPLPWESNINLN